MLGAALIVVSGVYIYSRTRSGSDAIEFIYSVPEENLGGHLGRAAVAVPPAPVTGERPIPLEQKAPDVAGFAGLYPGNLLNPKYWSEPEWAGSDPFGGPTIPDGFIPVLSTDLFRDFDPSLDATGMRIPAINVNSSVVELAILDLGNQRAYQTPDNTVGHIPESANAGEQGTSWFFGHTESPISREGSVFFNLQKVPEKLRNGEDVYIITDNGVNQFLYRATSTKVVHQNDLRLDATPGADINLVSSVPRFVYDHRLVVSGELIALR